MRPIGSFNAALGGLNRQLEGFERKSAEVVERSVGAEGFEPIDISSGARGTGETLNSTQTAGLQGAMVDMRVAKYLAVANMQVLKTQDDLAKAAQDLIAPRQK